MGELEIEIAGAFSYVCRTLPHVSTGDIACRAARLDGARDAIEVPIAGDGAKLQRPGQAPRSVSFTGVTGGPVAQRIGSGYVLRPNRLLLRDGVHLDMASLGPLGDR